MADKLSEDNAMTVELFSVRLFRTYHVLSSQDGTPSLLFSVVGFIGLSIQWFVSGKKGLKKYKGLMLRRINWAEPPEVEGEQQQEDAPVNYCELVWEGSVQQPAFERFSVEVKLLTVSCPAVVCVRFLFVAED